VEEWPQVGGGEAAELGVGAAGDKEVLNGEADFLPACRFLRCLARLRGREFEASSPPDNPRTEALDNQTVQVGLVDTLRNPNEGLNLGGATPVNVHDRIADNRADTHVVLDDFEEIQLPSGEVSVENPDGFGVVE